MKNFSIRNITRPLPSPVYARAGDDFFSRLLGLTFRSRLSPDQGFLLIGARNNRLESAIHMLFVFMDLAIIWINSDGKVVDTALARSWRPFYLPRTPARYVLEIHPSRLKEFRTGDEIKWAD